jgi:hypothetical protein
MKFSALLFAGALSALAAVPAQATPITITFDSLPVLVDPLTSYQEAGFSMVGNGVRGSNLLPGSTPSIVTINSQAAGAQGDLNFVELDATTFQFTSLDWANTGGGTSPSSVLVVGFLGAGVVGADTFTSTSSNAFSTYAAVNLAGKTIDHLTILLTNADPGTLNPQIDTIRFDNAPANVSPSRAWPGCSARA